MGDNGNRINGEEDSRDELDNGEEKFHTPLSVKHVAEDNSMLLPDKNSTIDTHLKHEKDSKEAIVCQKPLPTMSDTVSGMIKDASIMLEISDSNLMTNKTMSQKQTEPVVNETQRLLEQQLSQTQRQAEQMCARSTFPAFMEDHTNTIRSFVTGESLQMRNEQSHIHRNMNEDSDKHHRRHSRKKRDVVKEAYFEDLNELCKIIRDGIGCPKMLYGLFGRPVHGFDSSLFVKYEEFVNRMYCCVEKMESLEEIDDLESLY